MQYLADSNQIIQTMETKTLIIIKTYKVEL